MSKSPAKIPGQRNHPFLAGRTASVHIFATLLTAVAIVARPASATDACFNGWEETKECFAATNGESCIGYGACFETWTHYCDPDNPSYLYRECRFYSGAAHGGPYYWPESGPASCPPSMDQCDGTDTNFNGCTDEGCAYAPDPTQPQCTCTKECPSYQCFNPTIATCRPQSNGGVEVCGNERDDNCNGQVDEGCIAPPGDCKDPPCIKEYPDTGDCNAPKEDGQGGTVGADPLVLATRSAVTTPFTDFSVQSIVRLSVTRTYNSGDASVGGHGGTPGVFGLGWHHDWESSLTCAAGAPSTCLVSRPGLGVMAFRYAGYAGAYPPYEGETWDVYYRSDSDQARPGDRSVLIRRQTGAREFILFGTDGREHHYGSVCDSCGTPDAYCTDPYQGGRARLVRVIDAARRSTSLAYARGAGLFFSLTDDLGNKLELRNSNACSEGLVRELWYNGARYVTYAYGGLSGRELDSALDSDGNVLRSYTYQPNGSGRLLNVLNESGAAVAEFGYDSGGSATSLVDPESSASVSYDSSSQLTVQSNFGTTSTATRTISLGEDSRASTIIDPTGSLAVRWNGGRVACTEDALQHVRYFEHDVEGRLVRKATFAQGAYTCADPSPPTLPPEEEEFYSYDALWRVANGVDVPLDQITRIRRSTVVPAGYWLQYPNDPYSYQIFDYDQGYTSIDPPGYLCSPGALTNGLLCRRIEQGYTVDGSATNVLERHVTFYSYDARGRLIGTIGPMNLDRPFTTEVTPKETRAYWSDTDPSVARRGRLFSVAREPGGGSAALVTQFDYDVFGVSRQTEPRGATTVTVKDGRGRPKYVVAADLTQTEYRYYSDDAPRLVLRPSGAVMRYGYDGKGRLATTEPLSSDPDAPGSTATPPWTERRVYDPAGNPTIVELVKWVAGQPIVTRRRLRDFDQDHVLQQETHPVRPTAVKTWSYDSSGFLSGITDEDGKTTTFVPDSIGRTAVVRKSGSDKYGAPVSLDVATYGYQAGGGPLSGFVDGAGKWIQYVGDDFGRTVAVGAYATSTLGAFWLTHDTRNNLVREQRGPVAIDRSLDALNRLTKTRALGAAPVTNVYAYDQPGQEGLLSSIIEVESGRSTTYTYDAVGRVRFETVAEPETAVPLVTEYRYDADGDLDTLVYASGLSVKFERDPATKEVTEVRNLTTSLKYASGVTHWPAGPVEELVLGNGYSLSQTFNLRYEPTSINSGPLALVYTMSNSGSVNVVQSSGASATFGYDFLDRLTSVVPGFGGGIAPLTFTYSGDRVIEAWTGQATLARKYAFGYDYRSNLSAVSTYDAAGSSLATTTCLVHDSLNRLVVVGPARVLVGPDGIGCQAESDVASVQVRFRYDAANRRVGRWDASTGAWKDTSFLPNGSPLTEQTWNGTSWATVREYVWLDGRPLAQLDAGAANYFHLDHIGMPRALTDATGQLVWTAEPRPYGDVEETLSTVVTNLRLPGQYDERLFGSVGLQGPHYNRHRWYLPGVGRYLELDPIALRGHFNSRYAPDWYNYANGNPLRYIDPLGLYGTNDCSYYQQRCAESGGKYYCEQAQYWCNWFDRDDPDPDPTRDDDYEGWTRCTRQCLQDCDREENKNQNACPPQPDPRKGPWDPRSTSFDCHAKCYSHCASWGVGREDKPPY